MRRSIWGLIAAALAAAAVPGTGGAQQPIRVETAMRNVDYHIDATLIMHIGYLRGRLVGTRAGQPPWFDDPTSFGLEMDTATIALTTQALGDLLNRYVFNYHGSPLRKLRLSVTHGQLVQKGRLHGLPFRLATEVSVTPTGELRLHPVSIHAFGIGVKGLLHVLGLSLQKLANVKRAAGVRIDGNDLLLTPATMLPPPLTRGRLVTVLLGDSSMTLHFGGARAAVPLAIPDPHASNYLYYKGGTIRFWTLTMTPADLLVVDRDPRDPFDFWLARYKSQLLAGMSRNTADGGLITTWPDLKHVLASGSR
ncbi:MAG: hypothetical protein ACREK8_00970 [Gemmatimonadales bacterium]